MLWIIEADKQSMRQATHTGLIWRTVLLQLQWASFVQTYSVFRDNKRFLNLQWLSSGLDGDGGEAPH